MRYWQTGRKAKTGKKVKVRRDNRMLQERLQGWKRWYGWCERILFPVILFFYPLRHIFLGVEWWDTGYNYGNFLYMDRMDPMWVFSTYLGNALGNLFTRMPLGNRMSGLNLYTGLLVCLLALMGYYFFIRKVKLPPIFAFAGEMLALNLCWCPTALLYNYLTYVLFGAGTIALYCALTENKKHYFVLAGIFLGLNVFVRFPNLAEMGMILSVWAYGLICRKKGKTVLAETLWCILGYAVGVGLCLAYLTMRYSFTEYIDAIRRLMEMPSEASGYTVYSMIHSQWRNYLQNLIWLGHFGGFLFLGILGFAVLPGRLVKLKKIGYVVCVFLSFYYMMMHYDMFNLRYTTKESVFQWSVFLLTATIAIGLVTIVRPGAAPRDKLILGMGILIQVITPLGSNNHLYSSINNLFLAAPFTLWMLYRLIRWMPKEVWISKEGIRKERSLKASEKDQGPVGFLLASFPVKAMLLCMIFMLGIQSMGFGLVYVFSESGGGENLHTRIEDNDVLKGMYTSPDRAEVIESISSYVSESGLTGKEVILYGKIPAMSYYLQMPFAITSWPDLLSYNYSIMEADLEAISVQIAEGKREPPVLLLEAGLKDSIYGISSTEDAKLVLLLDWAKQYAYEVTFENEKFILLQSAK